MHGATIKINKFYISPIRLCPSIYEIIT